MVTEIGAVYFRRQSKIQSTGLYMRWYDSGGDGPITHPPLIYPREEPIAVGDLFIHRYRAFKEGMNVEIEQIWLLKKIGNKLQWQLAEDKDTTHHPKLKD